MGVDRIGEVGDRASERQAAGVYGAGFTAKSLARKGARGGTRGMGNKVSPSLYSFAYVQSGIERHFLCCP